MRKKIQSFITLTTISALVVLGFSFIDKVNAGASHNISGFAWSENIGWISFNNVSDGAGIDYGVNVDQGNTGDFSGFAWSENIGWVDFAPTVVKYGAYPETPNRGARLEADNTVTGWAYAVAGGDLIDGWDGWIKMSGIWDDGITTGNYGVSLSGNKFIGFAWGSDVVGWIDFDPGIAGSGVIIGPGTPPVTECNDGIDNADSEDILVDMLDPGCTSSLDNDETDPVTECNDGIDNADPEDTLVDILDPGCSSSMDNDETDPSATFSLAKSGNISITVVSGSGDTTSSSATITVVPTGGFTGDVSLSATSAISGATYNFTDYTLVEEEYNADTGSVFSITIPDTISSGTYPIVIKGSGSGLDRTVDVVLVINRTDPGYGEF